MERQNKLHQVLLHKVAEQEFKTNTKPELIGYTCWVRIAHAIGVR